MATSKRSWKLQEFVAHGSSVTCLSLGRKSGRVLATGGEDKKVNLWAVGKPSCIMSLTGHTTTVESVKFGHSEDMVCAGSFSGALKIWDLEAAKIVRTLTGHKASVRCLDFHPYGDFITSGSQDTNIKLWDIRRKGCIYTYMGHSKGVSNLKFSPDGRWIASGSEDGTVRLWDLPGGKLLTELKGHSGPITDVEFHPNEFLLASASQDRTIKFWDLESFQAVSTTDGDSALIKCIYFNPEGDCLFSGAQDVLKVYGWEPARTYDTLIMGWGKVSDLVTSQHQLIAGSFTFTNVSIYIVDLKRVQPFGPPPPSVSNNNNTSHLHQHHNHSHMNLNNTSSSSGSHSRKSFTKAKNLEGFSKVEVRICNERDPSPPDIDPGEDDLSQANIQNQEDYRAHFVTRKEQSTKSVDCQTKGSPFLPPLDSPHKNGNCSRNNGFNSTYTIPSSLGSTYTKATPDTIITARLTNPVKPMEKCPSVEKPESIVSIVRPVAKPLVFPELHQKPPDPPPPQTLEYIPDQRERPVGLDLEDFYPRYLQESLKAGIQALPEVSEPEAISAIMRGHQPMITVLNHRKKHLHIVLAQWAAKDGRTAVDTAIHMNDPAVIVDVVNILILRPGMWTLDICQLLLPSIHQLLQSRYESYMSVGCAALRLILKNFAAVIKANITAPPGVGVDISREERYSKCMSCYNQLLSTRSFLLKRQTLQGKLGQSFRELLLLMQSLE